MRLSILFLLMFFIPGTSFINGQNIFQNNSQNSFVNNSLINTSGFISGRWVDKANYEMRRIEIKINSEILSSKVVRTGQVYQVELFDGIKYLVRLHRIIVDVNGVLSITGRIEGTSYGYFYLSAKNNFCLGSIEIIETQKKYSISYDEYTNLHYLTEIDFSLVPHFVCKPIQIPLGN